MALSQCSMALQPAQPRPFGVRGTRDSAPLWSPRQRLHDAIGSLVPVHDDANGGAAQRHRALLAPFRFDAAPATCLVSHEASTNVINLPARCMAIETE